ncbi:MAG: M28 family peptidase [Chrysiogenales bacterium]|nr:MAG: M28 family peptidase [Chrysiogenales bacterium]
MNLEMAGQSGNLFYPRKTGIFITYYDASPELIERVDKSWRDLTGRPLDSEKSISDDSQCFMAAGIPSITIGFNGVPGPGMGGFHTEKDTMARVDPENLKLMARVIGKIIEGFR